MKKIIILISLVMLFACDSSKNISENKPIVFVSILPQKYFIEQLSDKVQVEVMVKPGHSPAVYEPTPKQIKLLSKAKIFFTIGVPFENSWIPKIKENYPNLIIVDTDEGIKKRELRSFDDIFGQEEEIDHRHHNHHGHNHKKGMLDPHVWLDPILVKIQSKNMASALNKYLSIDCNKNLNIWDKKLEDLDFYLKKNVKYVDFLVFHPSWGYFSERYNLNMIPIEIKGKTPTPREIKIISELVKKKNIKAIFTQQQFRSSEVNAIAEKMSIKVIEIDPLSQDYINNLKMIAEKLKLNE